ncbi:glucose-6-phosphate dehydrogenase [Paenibacillus gorillae]|uniref:glucose-6-phosphate dehydrogenase n=1 Tax=Paenibacillus gorillae TaxID=1243662 RepID=UPI0004BCE25B|nr:glucose-6-phosphate dehydrogenase [Paenibacillus gorillae]
MEATTFVLFGATGDLAKRKIYPALYNLFLDGKLPQSFTVFGLGRRALTDETFQANVEQSLRDFSRREAGDELLIKRFSSAFRYNVLDIGHVEDYEKLLNRIELREAELQATPNRLFYLSVGPEFFETIAERIQQSGLGSADGWKRLVIEKPFGHDLQSARDLNAKLSQSFAEEEVFRIDHYLGKPMVQRLEALQQENPVIQALWSNRYIANVQITASETVGVEERAGYYDQAGAVRDMFQNHMLQMLMVLAVQLPHISTSEKVRFKKKMVMEAVETLQKQDVAASVVRGQYRAGSINGQPVVGYTSEPGIDASSMNDTFIAARLQIDDFFWRGVPFYIRTGKRMKEKTTRIVIEFKEPLQHPASEHKKGTVSNLLIFEISPNEGITLQINTKDTKNKGQFKPVQIDLFSGQEDAPEAYENLIFDALHGDPTFFAHWDEVELAWQWVQPVLEAFEENLVPLRPYEAGSYGPAEAHALLAADGYHWWFDDKSEVEIQLKEGEQYAYNTNH